jgi:hypothetical protein
MNSASVSQHAADARTTNITGLLDLHSAGSPAQLQDSQCRTYGTERKIEQAASVR